MSSTGDGGLCPAHSRSRAMKRHFSAAGKWHCQLGHVNTPETAERLSGGGFQALPPARSVLSRELRRNGPVRWEFRRGLATSETCTAQLRYYSEYFQHSAYMPTTPRGEPFPSYSTRRRACAGTSSALSHHPCSFNTRTSSP
jgi:hypothetical protein